MGLPNIGYARAAELYPVLKEQADFYGKPLIPSVSAVQGEDPRTVLPDMLEVFAEHGATILEVNYSCPNKITDDGKREPILGYDLEQMAEVDQVIAQRLGSSVLLLRKLPPYLAQKSKLIPSVANIFAGKQAVGIHTANTVGGMQGRTERGYPALQVPGNTGGLSGPATKEIGEGQLRAFKALLPARVAVASSLGIWTGHHVFTRVHEQQADITGAVSIFYENERIGKSFGQTCQQIAEQYIEAVESAY
jgi:dihydroorotate dehydrogenase